MVKSIQNKYFIKILGISGIIIPIIFLAVLYISIQNAPWFSWSENAISDLGRFEYGLISFNYTLIAIGILLLFFSFSLVFSLKGERAGPTVLALSSIYFIGVGIYPLPHPNHVDISGLFFIAFPIGFLILGLRLYKINIAFIRNMGSFALIIVIISGFSPLFLIFNNGIAIPELVILLPGFFWCMIYSIKLLISKKIPINKKT